MRGPPLNRFVLPVIALVLASSAQAREPSPLARHYMEGETFGYRIEQVESRDGKTTRVVGRTSHRVVRNGDGFAEQVQWKTLRIGEDVRDAAAAEIPAYLLSLEAGQPLSSPRPDSVDILGLVTDLQTFYVAVSPALGAAHLAEPGDSHTRSELVVGDFADGATIVAGKDCMQTTMTLREVGSDGVLVTTAFVPPARSCLEAADSSDDMPENFRMVRRVKDNFLSLSGHERFTINTELEPVSGRIRHATMVNVLELDGEICRDAALTKCTAIPHISREREVSLELIAKAERG